MKHEELEDRKSLRTESGGFRGKKAAMTGFFWRIEE